MWCPGIRSTVIACSSSALSLLLATTAIADGAKAAAVTPRQLAHCLIQRIHEDRRGDRSESYQEAFKACKEDLAAEADHGSTTAMNAPSDMETAK
jgi:hypothetical protein